MSKNDISGLAVHIAARVMSEAGPCECIVSRTVGDLAAGADLGFEERGQKLLKGVSEPIHTYIQGIQKLNSLRRAVTSSRLVSVWGVADI